MRELANFTIILDNDLAEGRDGVLDGLDDDCVVTIANDFNADNVDPDRQLAA